MNAAGLTGRPNVDWYETHRQETIRVNVIGTLTLADLCAMHGIHMTNFATGAPENDLERDLRRPTLSCFIRFYPIFGWKIM